MKPNRISSIASFALTIFCWLGLSLTLDARPFTSTDGKVIEAEVTAVSGEEVSLKMKNNSTYKLPFTKFIAADQEYFKQWKLDEAKNRIPRVKIEYNSNKSDQNVRAGYDERKGRIKLEIMITNEERGFDIKKAMGTLVVLGEELGEDMSVVMQRVQFKDINAVFDQTTTVTADEIRYEYDRSGSYKDGRRYEGFVFVLRNEADKIVKVYGTTARFEKGYENLLKLKAEDNCDQYFRKLKTGNVQR